ncbi:MAG TPA: ABC transporter permease [Planctomycetota bacterium]|nr:ABC transporter permease [Planctomycetota bacterium]
MNFPSPVNLLGALGRGVLNWFSSLRGVLEHISGVFNLFRLTLYYSFIAPFVGRSRLRAQFLPMLANVGVKSFPIVFMISFLIGAILVIQTGPVMKQFGQTGLLPKMVALSMAREFGPVMTAIILTARVGASFTAVLASMKINDEVMALETMAIHPVGFLVAPRFLALLIMMPCLVVFSYAIGMLGGGLVAWQTYDIAPAAYIQRTVDGLMMADLYAGLIKAVVFSILISMICCYYGFITEGGPMGLGRNTMVAVVSTLVVIIIADALLGAFFMNYWF